MSVAVEGVATTRPAIVVTALGIVQILAWGSSYYLLAVLAPMIVLDTGWSLPWVIGGLTGGLLAGGVTAPLIGGTIQQRGGKPVLICSMLLLSSGLALIGTATWLPVYLVGWIIMGVGMAAGLYDAAFSTLGRLYGKNARRAITTLTLWGGFASTVCWPITAYLGETYGWRTACLVYAGAHLLISLPLILAFIPAPGPASSPLLTADRPIPARSPRATFYLLAVIFTIASLISSMLGVHLLTLLQLRGHDLAAAVAFGALIGPSQVGSRVMDMVLGSRYHAVWTMMASTILLAGGLVLLFMNLPVTGLAIIIYGAGNGIFSIARGALPLTLFDPSTFAVLMGRLALPSLLVQAFAPSLGAALIEMGGANLLLGAVAGLASINVLLSIQLLAHRH
ncbi:MFS transporter [Devosia naphthalenivorans]|uniref:MFS transporter n=1 Tax=Devosia naphthalenivorans TaxID=2082392 RepID=UPI000D3CFDF7|nr:MFS transporter [Devosia naphthalenivorans]